MTWLAQRNMGGVMPFALVSLLCFYIHPGSVVCACLVDVFLQSLVSVEIISDSL